MSFSTVLFTFLGLVLLGAVVLVVLQFFSKEDELINEAEERLARGEKKQASSLLSRVLEMNPTNPKARWMLGRVMQVAGRNARAARQYEFCLQNDALPDSVSREQALRRLHKIYEKENAYGRAIEISDDLVELNPENPDYLLERGRLHYRVEKYEEAIEDFQQLIEDFDDPPDEARLYQARSYYNIGSLSRALSAYQDYLEHNPIDLDTNLEAGSVAEENENYDEARKLYNRVQNKGDTVYYTRASLALVRLSILDKKQKEAHKHLEELEELHETNELPSRYELNYLYLRAKLMEIEEDRSSALDLYRQIYDRDPEFKDVEEILEQEIQRMDEEDLLKRFMNMGREDFSRIAEEVTRSMGYKVVSSESFGPDEVNVTAQDQSEMFKMNRVLVTFKRWEQIVAEWPLKEFELELLENRFDKGIFVSAHGFKPSAEQFAEQGNLELVGPDELIVHLREAYKFKK